MSNYIQNKITFTDDFDCKMMQKVLSTILRNRSGSESSPQNPSGGTLSLKERCSLKMVDFDFNTLVPMPEELHIESIPDSEDGHLLYEAYQNLPYILASQINEATIFEDVFTAKSESEVRRQCDAIFEQIAKIDSLKLILFGRQRLDKNCTACIFP